MTKVTTAQLELVANELNDLLSGEITGDGIIEGEPLVPSTGDPDEVMRKIHEAVDVLVPSDKLTDDLCEIIEKTSLGDAEFDIEREDLPDRISIRELFVTRTLIELEMPEKDEPEPEPEDEPEPDVEEDPSAEEEPPVENAIDTTMAERAARKINLKLEESTEEVPVPEPEKRSKQKETLADYDLNTLVKKLREEGVQVKRKSSNWERGKSPYSIALELACRNLDCTLPELKKIFVKHTGMKLDKITAPGVRTAHSLSAKVIRYLREEGHMPKKATRKTK
jgi:hypothetical protein